MNSRTSSSMRGLISGTIRKDRALEPKEVRSRPLLLNCASWSRSKAQLTQIDVESPGCRPDCGIITRTLPETITPSSSLEAIIHGARYRKKKALRKAPLSNRSAFRNAFCDIYALPARSCGAVAPSYSFLFYPAPDTTLSSKVEGDQRASSSRSTALERQPRPRAW